MIASAEVKVVVVPNHKSSPPSDLALTVGRTNGEGRFEAAIATDRSYFVQVAHPGYMCDEEVVSPSSGPATVEIVMTPVVACGLVPFDPVHDLPVTFSQHVVCDVTGRHGPLKVMDTATTSLLGAARSTGLDPALVAQRLAQGRLIVPTVPYDAEVRVAIHAPGYRAMDAVLSLVSLKAAMDAPTTIMMEPADGWAFVEIQLVEGAGERPMGTQYVIVRPTGQRGDVLIHRAVDPATRIGIMLPAGEYEAVFTPSQFDWAICSTFSVRTGEKNQAIVKQPARCTLRVTDNVEPRLPVLLHRVARKSGNAFAEVMQGVWPTTEDDVVVPGLPAGTYQVEAWFGRVGAVSTTFELRAGEEKVIRPELNGK